MQPANISTLSNVDYFCRYLVKKHRRHLICRICKFQLCILIYFLIFKIKLELSFMQLSIASSAATFRHLPRCSSSTGMTTGKSTSQDTGSRPFLPCAEPSRAERGWRSARPGSAASGEAGKGPPGPRPPDARMTAGAAAGWLRGAEWRPPA